MKTIKKILKSKYFKILSAIVALYLIMAFNEATLDIRVWKEYVRATFSAFTIFIIIWYKIINTKI